MQTLYIADKETEVRRRGRRLIIQRNGHVLKEVPAARIDNVVVLGSLGLSTHAVRLLMDAGVAVTFIGRGGRFYGRLEPGRSRSAALRRAQYSAAENTEVCVKVSREFIRGKILNSRNRLLRAARDIHGSVPRDDLTGRAKRLGALLGKLDAADDLHALRGYEGLAARLYFGGFKHMIRADGFGFGGRTRRPPRDPINALLSLSYAMLQTQIDGFVNTVGLDPYLGFLHDVRHGKPSLVLDLMEEFRPLFADRLATALINRRQLDTRHFAERHGGIELNEKGRRIFFNEFERRLRSEITHPLFGTKVTWRRCFELQVRVLTKVVLGQIPDYVPCVLR